MPVDYAILKTECTTNRNIFAYDGWCKGNCEAAFEWNAGVGKWQVVYVSIAVSRGSEKE